jgi:SAM-dependent methyltransferase
VADHGEFTLAQKLFLNLWCHKPPPEPYEPWDSYAGTLPAPEANPLAHASALFGADLLDHLRGCTFLDIGCGTGDQVVAVARAGAKRAVGVEQNKVYVDVGQRRALEAGLADRVAITHEPVESLGDSWADLMLSQNSFEHFEDPAEILRQAFHALVPGGRFLVTFSPPWWHPFGVHHMFMIRLPWAHVVFSEKTILRVRQLYRPNKPTCWREVCLNCMTISRFQRIVAASGFEVSRFTLTAIRPLPDWVTRLKLTREWLTSTVVAVLRKPA